MDKAEKEKLAEKTVSWSKKSIKDQTTDPNGLPDFLDYSKKYEPKTTKDNTGWKVRPENEEFFKK